jgi:hypothetical protein
MNEDDLPKSFVEARKLGCVSSSDWQSYTWKNELSEQRRRILQHLDEVLTDSNTEHNPLHMLERAIGVAAICMRRLIECRLVTDRFRDSELDVHEISVKANVEWREPFVIHTASEIFNNYDMRARQPQRRAPKVISDKMLHARVIAVLSGSAYLPDGLLVASDTQSKRSLFHFTPAEIAAVLDSLLTDYVQFMQDGFVDVDTQGAGKVFAIRS